MAGMPVSVTVGAAPLGMVSEPIPPPDVPVSLFRLSLPQPAIKPAVKNPTTNGVNFI
jgi:hypothetical protein